MNKQKRNLTNERQICIFDPFEDESKDKSEIHDYEEALIPIDDNDPFIKAQIANLELSMRLKQLEKIFDSHNRYAYALEKVEQAVRYLQGYLSDYTVTVRRELKPNKIVVIIEIEPYDELNTLDKTIEKLRIAIKQAIPDIPEEKIEEIINRLIA